MFKTLRSRLLIAFTAVITMVLVVSVLSLIFLSNLPRTVNLEQNATRLLRANRTVMQELIDWRTSRNNLDSLEQVLRRIAREQEVRILITNSQDRIIFDTDERWESQTFNTQEIPSRQLNSVSLNDNMELSRFRPSNDSTWLVVTNEVALRPGEPGKLVIGVPEPSSLGTFQQFFFRPLLQAACVSLLLAILLAAWITRSITRPLSKLAQATEAIAQGDYDYQVEPEGPQEVRSVATSFNAMAAQVKQTNQAQRDFVANVSHDLKTPITSIQGWSQALLDGAAQSPRQQEKAAAVIHTESGRMARLVNQLLDVARIESGQFTLNREEIVLNHVVGRVVEQLRPVAEDNAIVLTAGIPDEELLCDADADRIAQILTNLLDNALKHTPADGLVNVQLSAASNSLAQISVQDTGSGISAADLERVFERFYQVDKSRTSQGQSLGRRSIGLGLAIVKQLVEAHGGQIQVHSEVGRGSTFVVLLPLKNRAS